MRLFGRLLGEAAAHREVPVSYTHLDVYKRQFLTSPDWLGLDPDRLAFTVFAGDEDAPRDEEAANLWRAQGVKDDHLFYCLLYTSRCV